MPYQRELEHARRLARRAGEIALGHQTRGVVPENKPDLSPVTAADRECESLIAAAIEQVFPDDGFLGEEGAAKQSASGRRWIVDPIDGTRDFLRGHPTWGVLIALEEGRDIALGVAHFPAQDHTYFATRGGGAFLNDGRIRISSITDPAQAVLCINGFNDVLQFPFAPRLLEWLEQFWAVRSFGGCQDAVYVASGRAEAWVEPHGKAWDFAPLKVLVEEAGAVYFNFDGGNSIYAGNCAVCVPALELELRRFVLGVEKKIDPNQPPPLVRHEP